MPMISGPRYAKEDPARMHPWSDAARFTALRGVVAVVGVAGSTAGRGVDAPSFPTVPPDHKHARALLENAMRYAAPATRMIDPVSGYPFEGWNQDPKQGLFLRSFTQLTAIGQWMELLANVVAGHADTPDLSREQALADLTRLVTDACATTSATPSSAPRGCSSTSWTSPPASGSAR